MRRIAALLSLVATLVSCQSAPRTGSEGGTPAPKKVVIGLSLDTVREERWQRDRDEFVRHAESLGAEVRVQVANNDHTRQVAQCENLLTQGVDVLVVAPHDSESAATIVKAAHDAHVPVIAYDRLIKNSDVDLYLSFDNVQVGRLQAQYAVQRVPKGRYLLIAGAPTDHNAHLFRQGQMEVLQPFVDRGDIAIVADPWANDWQPVEALKIMENALTRTGNRIEVVVASNDGLAGGAVQAIAEQRLTGKVLVTGQDAELAACQRILSGTQSMTVYKSIPRLARRGAEAAIALARREPLTDATATLDNGFKAVPSLLIPPVAVDAANLDSTVVADGFHTREAIMAGVKTPR